MEDAGAKVIDLIFGRKRSQMLYVGVTLGVFDALAHGPRSAARVASALHEDHTPTFSLTPMGALLCTDHPHTLRGVALWEEGPESYATWQHLATLITEGQQNAFVREFGQPGFAYLAQHPSVGAVFNEAMSSYSSLDNALVLEALTPYDFAGLSHLCDVGGGHGSPLCSLLVQYPHLPGTVLDLPSVLAQHERLWAEKMGVGDRCTYMPGDMFQAVPPAETYMMKRVLHDWNDAECHQILATISRAAPPRGRVWIIERIVPGPNTPPFAKLFDVLMIIVSTGRERTLEEYTGLLAGAGWTYRQTWYPASKMLGGVEGVQA